MPISLNQSVSSFRPIRKIAIFSVNQPAVGNEGWPGNACCVLLLLQQLINDYLSRLRLQEQDTNEV